MTARSSLCPRREKAWENWMAAVCQPFAMAKIKYFDV